MKTSLFITVVSLLLSACGTADKEKQSEELLLVRGEKAASVHSDVASDFPFIAKPYRATDLSFRISGPLEKWDVHAGRFYRKGETIAAIDPRDFIIQKERTEAAYMQAKAEFERIEVLYKKDNLSASAYEKARATYVAAKTAFQSATNELTDTKLTAPFDGYAGEVYVENYQEVKASQPVLSFEDIARLKIEIYVPQNIALGAGKTKELQIELDGQTDRPLTAQLEEVSKSTTRNNLSYLVTAILPNPTGELLAGMSGRAFFPPSQATGQIVTLPAAAVCHNPTEGDFVWVIDPSTSRVSRRPIMIGQLLSGGAVHIVSGVKAGEMVSTSSNRFLSEGRTIQLINQ